MFSLIFTILASLAYAAFALWLAYAKTPQVWATRVRIEVAALLEKRSKR
jgi:hypothetical protein